MFCYQCEQTAKGTGCTAFGVCGKDPDTAALQDLLVHATKGVSWYAARAARLGAQNPDIDVFVIEALFTTVTNVNFDAARVADFVRKAVEVRQLAADLYLTAAEAAGVTPDAATGPATFTPAASNDELVRQGEAVSPGARIDTIGDAAAGLEELVVYGLKGAAAYLDHAQVLGYTDPALFARFHETLDFLCTDQTAEALTGKALEVGEINLGVMELLDGANTGVYGHPEPTAARITPVKGKAILVSGHDLKDLEALLEQTAGKGVNVYTHGEMLPALAYPGLKKHPHLVGNYGSAWQDQRREFEDFPGAILMTTNCIQMPKESYKARIFTTGLVAWPDVTHVTGYDFAPVIDAALEADGFTEDAEEKTITIGFGRNAVLGVADKVVDAVKQGAIKHFFLVGGCDGAKPGRNYYTEFAQKVPQDTVLLTLACGKYRFNTLDFGDIGGIPRLLDIGQCNDAYSAIKIAMALANAFGTDVNSLPLSMVLSWYEQKAVAILLTLLHLGIKNIRIGPSLPAFLAPPVVELLVREFGLAPTTTPDADIAACLAS
jgi:hydroxylamine reductase